LAVREAADASTMAAYWADVRLFFQRAHGTKTVVLHVEPDLWGYIEQRAGARAPVAGRRNTRWSLSADDGGGYFAAQARAYYATDLLPLRPH
jgi:hypothetical protein